MIRGRSVLPRAARVAQDTFHVIGVKKRHENRSRCYRSLNILPLGPGVPARVRHWSLTIQLK